ncbi:PAS domain-containing sensor histidine kinase [Desulfocurvus sp.]|uniref:PAS domain-containing sensor histidine kinase n=1 Tax=Desulfocurvus sp. TaxID=2871698 RepID=UPI0025C1CC6B|nr:PAS domain-containing sensor histidine kinase [Desulfocurvus sp.]MCK9239097.1 PAS domain S-box protein [Desulfocurvus sp.]
MKDGCDAGERGWNARGVLEAAQGGFWSYDIDGGGFLCGPGFPELAGCGARPGECAGPFCRNLLHPGDLPGLDAALAACAAGASDLLEIELHPCKPDGNWCRLLVRGRVAGGGPGRRLTGLAVSLPPGPECPQGRDLFASVFEHAQIPMLLLDPDTGRIEEANARACLFYGYSREALGAMTIMEINALPPGVVLREMEAARRAQRTFFRFRHRLASGELREVEVHSGPVRTGGRNLLYSIIHDITDRLRAEEALRRSEALMSGIFRAAPVGMGTVRHRVVGTVNDVLCRMVGYEARELRGQSASILYPSIEEFVRVGRERSPQVERFGSGTVETVFRRKDGTSLSVLLGSAWLDPEHPEEGMIFTVQDITERKRAERELSRVRRAMHQLADAMPSALFVVDSQDRITLCNGAGQALCAEAGLPVEGLPLARALPGFPGLDDMLRALREDGAPLSRKAMPHETGGTLRYWDLLLYPLESLGQGEDGLAVVRLDEVTARVLMEETLIQSEKMMSVGGLAAGMAHEINNPLAGILQGAQNIRRRLDPGLPANREAARALGCPLEAVAAYMEQREILHFLDGISESGSRAAAIVANMLNFARGGQAAHAPLDLNHCLREALQLVNGGYDLARGYDFRHIAVDLQLDPRLPAVPGSAQELQQVFLNLLTNAAHALTSPPGAAAHPRITLRTYATADAVVAEVRDNGPGIPEDRRARIFDPFFTTKAPGQGTGLGLSVSYFIVVRNHAGTIAVDSQPGAGTCFTVRLPRNAPRRREAPPEPEDD